MTTWFTSDPHFGHAKIIEYCDRPFKDAHEMNRGLVERWNSKVQNGDLVYLLGDISFKEGITLEALSQLNGNIVLVKGNHDHISATVKRRLVEVVDYKEIKIPDEEMDKGIQRIILMHYPIESWNHQNHGSWHFHGHVHGTNHHPYRIIPGRLDVGMDAHNWYPISYEEAKTILTKRMLQGE